MINRVIAGLLIALTFPSTGLADDDWQPRDDWGTFFAEHEAQGTIMVLDQRGETPAAWVFNESRAQTPYSPASTYKIPHALFALDAGIVHDEFQVFKWDGVQRSYEPWNRDQNLRTSMRHSVVWVYQSFAQELGKAKAREYLNKIAYGNADPSGEDEPYWVEGNLRITAAEQMAFLQRLYRNELPFDIQHQRLVKDIMIVQADRDWVLRAKTGWEGRMGWWVGWVEQPTGPVFFVLNIDTPNRFKDLHKREAITRAILRSIDALPKDGQQ